MIAYLRRVVVFSLLFFLLLGGLYPAVVTLGGQVLFSDQAQGSVIEQNGTIIGSRLIGQNFLHPSYFWGRPSATPDYQIASGASNLAITGDAFQKIVTDRAQALTLLDPTNPLSVPADLVTSSGSGIDPDISPEAAAFQIPRIARLRGRPLTDITALVEAATQKPQFGFLGKPRVNVLRLNLALDGKIAP